MKRLQVHIDERLQGKRSCPEETEKNDIVALSFISIKHKADECNSTATIL